MVSGGRCASVESGAVVLDLDHHAVSDPVDADLLAVSRGMSPGVGEGFLNDPVRGDFGGQGEVVDAARDLDIDV